MQKSARDTILSNRLSEADQKAVLDRLDARESDKTAKNRRGGPRLSYRRPQIVARISQPGGTQTSCYVATRDLSDGGAAFIYNGFLYKNTLVELLLPRLGGDDKVAGLVTHCALLHKMVHLVGLKFTSKIYAPLYLNPRELGDAPQAEAIDRSTLRGTLVHLAPADVDGLLLEHFLKGTNVRVICTRDTGDTLKAIEGQPVHGVLLSAPLAKPAEAIIPQLRAAGFGGPAALIMPEPHKASMLLERLGVVVIAKPFDPALMLTLLAQWLTPLRASA